MRPGPASFALMALVLLVRPASAVTAEYVADRACAGCHAAKFASYQGVGMAQSMRRPRAEVLIEDFGKGRFFHKPSQSYFEMAWTDGKLLFRRYQLDAQGRRINFIEQQVDWIVGSGHRSRVYLYRTPSGELYQLPIAWYTEEKGWGMAPGYDRPDHDGITRTVRRECLFCHNAYPQVKEGSDRHWSPQTFSTELPEGTGCQRCHGPGAAHVEAALGGGSEETLRAAIVNPAKLPPPLRDAVCFQCHLLPAVSLIGVRRFDRGDYSFRPGEPFANYMLHVDVDEAGRARDQRFEINHHAYRLRQSPTAPEWFSRWPGLTGLDDTSGVRDCFDGTKWCAHLRHCHLTSCIARDIATRFLPVQFERSIRPTPISRTLSQG